MAFLKQEKYACLTRQGEPGKSIFQWDESCPGVGMVEGVLAAPLRKGSRVPPAAEQDGDRVDPGRLWRRGPAQGRTHTSLGCIAQTPSSSLYLSSPAPFPSLSGKARPAEKRDSQHLLSMEATSRPADGWSGRPGSGLLWRESSGPASFRPTSTSLDSWQAETLEETKGQHLVASLLTPQILADSQGLPC